MSNTDDLRIEISIFGRNYLRSFCLITFCVISRVCARSAAVPMYYECIDCVCARSIGIASVELVLAWESCEMAAAEFKSLNFQLLSEDEMQELLDGTDTASTKRNIKFGVAKFETFLRQKQLELS